MFTRFLASLKNTVFAVSKTVAIAGLLICIITTICASIELLAKNHPITGIIISSLLCCIFMIPLTLLCLNLFKSTDASGQEKSVQNEQEINKLRKEKNDYKRKIMLLENLSFNMVTYQDVLKMCFRDYKQEGIIKQRESFNEEDYSNPIKKLLGATSKNYDEVLSIIDWLVTYQRGVDFTNIRIAKTGEDSVVISGITPVFTTPPHFEYKDFCTEIRHVKLDKNGDTKQITIENGDRAQSVLQKKTDEYKHILEENFAQGNKPEEDSFAIKTRAQDFLRIILQPIYKNIEFEEQALSSNSIPLLEFLNNETDTYKKLLAEESQHNAE